MNNLTPVKEDLFQKADAKRAEDEAMATTTKVAAAASVVPLSQPAQQKQIAVAPTTGGAPVTTTPITVATANTNTAAPPAIGGTTIPLTAGGTVNPGQIAAGGALPLPPVPQQPPLQQPGVPPPAMTTPTVMGIQAALTRQIAAADNSTYANEVNWQKDLLGDTTKCDNFCEEVVGQQDLRVFGWITLGSPYVQVMHSLTKFMDVGGFPTLRGKVIGLVGN